MKNRSKIKYKLLILPITIGLLALDTSAGLLESSDSVSSTSEVSLWDQIESAALKSVAEVKKAIQERVDAITEIVSNNPKTVDFASRSSASESITSESANAPNNNATLNMHVEKSKAQSEFSNLIGKAEGVIRKLEVIEVASEGRVGTSQLPKSKSGVPKYEAPKVAKGGSNNVSSLPKLDIGTEKSISYKSFLPPDGFISLRPPQKIEKRDTPDLMSAKTISQVTGIKIPVVAKAQSPKNGNFELGQIVTHKKIEDVSLAMNELHPLEALKPYTATLDDDIKLLAAIILFQNKNKCHLTSGLLTDLIDKKKYFDEANYYLGLCANQMGFHSEAASRLLKAAELNDKSYAIEAIKGLTEDLPEVYEDRVAAVLKKSNFITDIGEPTQSNINFIFARTAYNKGEYSQAIEYSQKVLDSNKNYLKARYVYGIALYASKNVKESEKVLLATREWMSKGLRSDKNIEALIAVNLARMHFTQGRYAAAVEEYMKIPKDHPLWVQALIEQGWAQLNTDDPAGAIGNMYSLHSPYFKSVFMPESWVVRTIGYINICQFGDAYKTLTKLEQMHSGWLNAVDNYKKINKSPDAYYATIKKYVKGKSDANVDGMPYQVIREIARQRGFLDAQNSINILEDEVAQFTFIYGLIKKDQSEVSAKHLRTQNLLARIKSDLAKTKTNSELAKNINEWSAQKRLNEQLLEMYDYQNVLFEQARKGYVKMKANSLARIEAEKSKFKNTAGRELIDNLADISKTINQIFESNEFLRYEIFSGSGENIRYQVAGGAVSDEKRIPANIKPQKILNWEFDGEYWEDEIGSYRSTLQNNCPNHTRTALGHGEGEVKSQ